MTTYLYRRGDGNEGNFPRAIIDLTETDNPYAALRALLANDYIARGSVRRHIIANTEIDGEAEYGISATVYKDPEGEQAFGAAWITAELQPVSKTDIEACYYGLWRPGMLRTALDNGAWKLYRKHAAKG